MTISPERLRELIEDYGSRDPSFHNMDVFDLLRELEAARTQLEGVAKGTHVIVPREPTTAMVKRAKHCREGRWIDAEWVIEVYRAMLSAAPPQGEPQI